jgi:hypothetical protein
LLSSATRFEARLVKAIHRPSAESEGPPELLLPGDPSGARDSIVVV